MLTLNHANLPVADVPQLRDFFVDTPEKVRDTHARLVSAGVATGDVEEITRRGVSSVTFYCTAPNDILIEVSCYR